MQHIRAAYLLTLSQFLVLLHVVGLVGLIGMVAAYARFVSLPCADDAPMHILRMLPEGVIQSSCKDCRDRAMCNLQVDKMSKHIT